MVERHTVNVDVPGSNPGLSANKSRDLAMSRPAKFSGTSVQEAKHYLQTNFKKGVHCPCCTQFVKEYKRSLHSGMATSIIAIYRETGGTKKIVEMSKIKHKYRALIASQGNFAKLRYWELLNQPVGLRADGCKNNGQWNLTDKGIAFVEGKITVPKYAFTFNTKCYRKIGPEITIHDALGNHFNYRRLMAGL